MLINKLGNLSNRFNYVRLGSIHFVNNVQYKNFNSQISQITFQNYGFNIQKLPQNANNFLIFTKRFKQTDSSEVEYYFHNLTYNLILSIV